MNAQEIKKAAISYHSFDFDDTPRQDDVEGVAEWLNKIIKRGAVFFAQVYDGDTIKLVAFSQEIPSSSLEKIQDLDWVEHFDYLDSEQM